MYEFKTYSYHAAPTPTPYLQNNRNFWKKTAGEGQKILILEGRLCYRAPGNLREWKIT